MPLILNMYWQTKKLGEIIELHYGRGISRHERKTDGEYVVYGANGELGRTDKYLVDGDTIIVGRKGSAGEVVRVSGKFWPSDVTYYVFGNDKINIDYLFYFFKNIDLTKFAVGVKPGINRNRVYELEIPLPPLPEQKKIVKLLDEKMGKIAEAKRVRAGALAETEKILSQTLHEIFIQKQHTNILAAPVRLVPRSLGEVGSLARRRENVDILAGEQKEWKNVLFGDENYIQIIDGDRGKNYPTKIEFSREGYCLFLNTSNVRKGNFDFSRMDFITKEKSESLRKGRVARGDLILTTRGTLGNSAHYNDSVPYENLRINSGMVVLRIDQKKIMPQYLIYIINSNEFIKKIKEANSGSAQPQLPIKVLSKLSFPLPPLSIQQKIVNHLGALSAKVRRAVELQKDQLEDFKKLEKAYLREAFGEKL